LVNYIRNEVKNGNLQPDVSSTTKFADDKYLQPVLEDDALLFSIDDLDSNESSNTKSQDVQDTKSTLSGDAAARIQELEEKLSQTQYQFAEYQKAVQETLDKRWQDLDTADKGPVNLDKQGKSSERDAEYFDSYSYNGKQTVAQIVSREAK
jgi:protein arginine N-methyltransferase 3